MKSLLQTLAYILILALSFTFNVNAQQNGDMEEWSSSGSPPPFDWKYPTGWTSTNATSEFNGASITRSTEEHSGTYAAQLRTANIFGTLTRSQLGLGNVKLDFPMYRLVAYTGGEPLPMFPNQVSFFYKLTVGHSNEYAVADVLIKRREAGDPYPDTVYHVSTHLQEAGVYTEVNIPIVTDNINPETDSILIVFSSNDTNEIAANTLLIDDVSIDFASAVNPSPNQNTVTIFPNPVHTNETLHFATTVEHISIFNPFGIVLFSINDSDIQSIDLSKTRLAPGIYFLRVNDEKPVKLLVTE